MSLFEHTVSVVNIVCCTDTRIYINFKKADKTSSALMIFIYQRVKYQYCIKNQKNGVTYVSIIWPFVLEKKLGQPISVSFLEAGFLQEQVPVSTANLVDKCCQFFSSFKPLQLAP